MKPRVSIIMGIYNCADTLPEAIDSILAQTYTDWQLIMCDDGSTDNTYDVAERYRSKFPDRIKLIKNEYNMGLNYTLNHCLEYADTEFIARMDGDDISLPERLEKEINFLDAHPEYGIVSCPMIYFDETGDWGYGKDGGEPRLEDVPKGTPFCHAPCMVRKRAYDAVGGYTVDEKYLRVEDYDLWVKMLSKGFRGYSLNEHLYKMRDDRNAKNRRSFQNRINEARVKVKAIRELGLPRNYYIYVLRPIITGLMPDFIYDALHKIRLRKNIIQQ